MRIRQSRGVSVFCIISLLQQSCSDDIRHVFNSLATETETVRSTLVEYANDLLSLGVDGLRLDAAKRELSRTVEGDCQHANP